MSTLNQVVIVRTQDGGFRILEQGLGESGHGETLREHDLHPEISVDMAGKYLVKILNELVAVVRK